MRKFLSVVALAALVSPMPDASLLAQSSDPNVVFDAALYEGMKYRSIGPSRGGRVTTVTGVASQPSTFYMGSVGGGIWKTTDYGHNWWDISGQSLETGSMGAINVADSDPNIIYAGTGSDGMRAQVVTGRGMYKSTDAGETWNFIGLRTAGQIGAVEIHPTNPNVVFVAAIGNAFAPNPDRGVFRTTDGGANWEKVLFVSDSTGAVDVEFSPDNPNELYATTWRAERKPWTIISGGMEGGAYKSTDGGTTWTQLTNGLPQGLRGKADLAVSRADPNRVYVLFEAVEPEDGIYRSDDRGQTWRQITSDNALNNRPFYYTNIDADPTNADVVYVNNGSGFHKSTDAGVTWERIPVPHGDNHDMWINPNDPNLFIQSNDGGVNVTRDGGRTWSTQSNQPTAELYQVNIDDRFPYWVYAGQQDNSTIMVPSLPPISRPGGPTAFWMAIGGCEPGPAVPKPGNPDVVYSNCKGRFGRYNQTTGQEKQYYVGMTNIYGHNTAELRYRFQRTSPIHISPHNPNVVYHASQYLHRTTDEGVTWEQISPDLTANTPETQMASGGPITRDITGEEYYSTLYAVQESPLQRGLIWVGANDGPIHVTRDDGETWTNVTPPDLPPGGRVQTVEASPHSASKAYVAVLRFQLGDFSPHIYRTNDYGETWTKLTTGTNGIPADSPTRVVREDPDREGLLYAGTEFGMYISFDDGAHWQSFQQNLPTTPVSDFKVHQKDLVISTMGRSFWILDDLTPLHQLTDEIASSNAHLFAPRDAYRMRYGGRGGGRGPANPADPEYLPAGAVIDYYLAAQSPGEITLEIQDANGNLVRGYSSEAAGETMVVPDDPGMREFRLEGVGTPRLPNGAGMHRFIWDGRHAGPWSESEQQSGRQGPLAVPGTYQARLTVGGRSQTHQFAFMADPRIVADGVTQQDMADQLALSIQVRDALSEARLAVSRIDDAREDIEQGIPIDRQLADLLANLETPDGYAYPTPMLVDQLQYLYGNLNRADQEPGTDSYERYTELEGLLRGYIRDLERLLRANAAD